MEGDRKIINNLEIYVKIIQKWIKVFTSVVFVLCMMNIIVPENEVWRLFDTCSEEKIEGKNTPKNSSKRWMRLI